MKDWMVWIGKFLKYLAHRFVDDNLSNIAAMLTLTSLLALIPLLAVIFTILSAMPYVQNLGAEIQLYIFSNFVPSFSQNLEQTISGFVQKAADMKTLGFSSLVVTAIMLVRTVDTGFNQIWRTRQKRKALVAFLIYWLVLIVGPLLLGLSIVLTSYFTSLLVLTDTGRQIDAQLTIFLPWMLTTMGLSILYLVIPNIRVKFLHAFIGAMVAGLLFEIAKRLFTMYVTSFPLQEIIFGALSAVPLFLIWIYLSWLVILLGAEVCHGLENFTPDYQDESEQANHFLDCLRVLYFISDKNELDTYPDRTTIIDELDYISDTSLVDCLYQLQCIGLISEQDNGSYRLLDNLNNYSLLEFIESVPWKIPTKKMVINSYFADRILAQELISIIEKIQQQPTCSLKQVYHQVS